MSTGSVYSSLKALAYADRIQAMREGNLSAPVHIRIKPTNVCNHNCWFCAYRTGNVTLGEDMVQRDRIPKEKMAEICEDLIEMGVKAVTFSGGGEPLIYPYIAETVTRLAEGGIQVAALTNGAQLRGKVADAFAAHGTWLRVSIDGWDGPSYAKYRETKPDEFEKVMTNLAEFSARGSACVLGASVIVDETNASHVFELVSRLKSCGVDHVKIAPCIVSNEGTENNAYHRPIRDTVHAEIGRCAGLVNGSGFHVVNHYHDLEERFDKAYHRCPFARLLTVIGADQTVYTCQDKAYTQSGVLGSIKERRFRDFWYSDENRSRLAALDPAVVCRHHCVADSKNRLLDDFLNLDPEHLPFV